MSRDPALSDAMKRADDALSAMRSGDPQPYINCWAASPDATLFGPWGPMEHGAKAVTDTFQWVASRFTGGRADVEHAVIAQSGDLAYTVGFERGPASVAGGPSKEMVIRVTHLSSRRCRLGARAPARRLPTTRSAPALTTDQRHAPLTWVRTARA